MLLGVTLRFFPANFLLRTIQVHSRCCISLSFPSYSLPLGDGRTISKPSTYSIVHGSTNQGETNFLRLLSLCCKTTDLKQFKSLLILHGLMEDKFLVGEFFRFCFHLDSPELALSSFQKIEKPSLLLQNILVRCLSNHGLFDDLLSIYIKCQKSGCQADNFTFPFVIKACSGLGDYRTGKGIHCIVLKKGFEYNLVVQTALIGMYAKVGDLATSRLIFDRIPQPDLVAWNALLAGYSLNGRYWEAVKIFRRIQIMGLNPNASTLASIIPVCTSLRALHIGKIFHGSAVKFGVASDESLEPALISMYGGCGDLSDARRFFDFLPERNVIVWNALISTFTQNQKSSDALEAFKQMIQENMQPNAVSFVAVIPSCENFGDIDCGESLHAHAIKDGLECQTSVATAFLSMHAKLGNLDSAELLFHGIPERNLLSWNSMISGYVQNGLWELGLNMFHNLRLMGFTPDSISMVSVLSACTRSDDIRLGKSAHAFTIRSRLDFNLNVSNALLAFYSDSDQLPYALKLFNKIQKRNVVTWNILISRCVHSGHIGNAVELLQQMQQADVELNLVTMISILPSYCKSENLVQGMAIHGHAIKAGYISDVSLVNALISMYLNCGELHSGRLLFEAMPEKSVVSWNALITGYRNHNLNREVIVCFCQMITEDQNPNFVTLLNILPVCWTELQGKSIHAYAIRTGAVSEPPLLTSLMLMYARFESVHLCHSLFEMADKNNISIWNTMMSVHVHSKNAKAAIATFSEMLQKKMEPDHVTVLTLISACIHLSSLDIALCTMGYIICKGFENDVVIGNALIDLHARCGNISTARKIFDSLIGRDSVSWSVIINGYGMHGDGETALSLFSEMKLSGVGPDDVTFISILSACSHAGLVEQGVMLFNSMVDHGVQPRMEHYACMVDLLGRTGHLHEAYALVKRLPYKPSMSLLESLLGACSIHSNIDLGEQIGRWLFEMDPGNSRLYVMLSNIYAAAGRWMDASRVRSDMEERRLRKVPGFSLLEVGGHRNG
ncbi:pentatricopeptide repeat-containing protein At5g39350-like [Macadamia integrifolia]|uniref:pentatricopeptide repeat-containing protein At5g39350-like n=1 Tax=Macadamia integrifolia TaxID=60698 RepID=UPI001C4F7EBA|nr:pentatricopeptide repeat-containing protein At5g39350-like [Macadamia integrifolia]